MTAWDIGMPDNNLLLLVVVYTGVVLAVLWLALVVWAYRDMRARSRDTLAQLLVGLLVLLLNLPGVLIYVLLRPRETLSEAYERSLEEEALLQEIEEKPTCPGCGQRIQANWQACPHCHTRLKKQCYNCANMLELSWNLCPYCTAPQVASDQAVITDLPRAMTGSARARRRGGEAGLSQVNSPSAASALEFVDSEE